MDLITLYVLHRQHFEQLTRLLEDWRKARLLRAVASTRQEFEQNRGRITQRLKELERSRYRPGVRRSDSLSDSEQESDSDDSIDVERALRIANKTGEAAQATAPIPEMPTPHTERSPMDEQLDIVIDAFNESAQGAADFTRAIDSLKSLLRQGNLSDGMVREVQSMVAQLERRGESA